MPGSKSYVREGYSYSSFSRNHSNILNNRTKDRSNIFICNKHCLEIKSAFQNKQNLCLNTPNKNKYSYRKPQTSNTEGLCQNVDSDKPKIKFKTIHTLMKPESLLPRVTVKLNNPYKIQTRYTINHNTPRKSPKKQFISSNIGKRSRYRYQRLKKPTPRSSIKRKSSLKSNNRTPTKSFENPYKLRIKKAIETLRYRRKPICMHYARTGHCRNADSCHFLHDINYLRICPRFLLHTCPLGESKCSLAHVLDPCRVPQCEFFNKGECLRESCPYLHIRYEPNTPVCQQFLNGRCELGRKCEKQHKWLTKKTQSSCQSKRQILSHLEKKKPIAEVTSTIQQLPPGSLRDIFPAPDFIPFELDAP